MKRLGESVIFSWCLTLADRIRARVHGGLFARWREIGIKSEELLQSGTLSFLCVSGYERQGWQFRMRRIGMRVREGSLLGLWQRRFSRYLLQSALNSIGFFCLVTGILFFCVSLFFSSADAKQLSFSTGIVWVVSSLPLLTSRKSLSYTLRKSRILHSFLTSFCLIPEDSFGTWEKGRERLRIPLLASFLVAAVSVLISPLFLSICILLFLALRLVLFVPELLLLLIGLTFPFLQLLSHPTVILCALVLLTHLAWSLKLLCGRRDLTFTICDLLVALFCFLLLLGGVIGEGNVWQGVSLSCLASLYFPARNLLGGWCWRRRMRFAVLLGGWICSAYGIFQYFFTELSLRWVDVHRFSDIRGRVTSFFDNPNVLAIYLLLLFPCAITACADRRESVRARAFFGVTAASFLFCMVLTWSRGAWLGCLAEVLLLLLFYSRKSLALSFLLPIPLFSALSFLPANIWNRFSSIGVLGESSIRYRLYTWQGVLRMLRAHPYGIGVGSQAFLSVYPRYAISGTESVMHAHDVFLQVCVELGGGGLFVFLLLLVSLFLFPTTSRSGMWAKCALVGALVMGVFDHLWYTPALIAMFFLICAFVSVKEEL